VDARDSAGHLYLSGAQILLVEEISVLVECIPTIKEPIPSQNASKEKIIWE